MKSIFIGFDFSMNKPAATILYDKQFYHMIWPMSMDEKKIKKYEDCGVYVVNRGLDPVSKSKSSQLALEHTIRSTQLANRIVQDLDKWIEEHDALESPLYVSSEGLAFGSTGDATLNLATYKGVLLSKLYEHYFGRMYGLYTYAPITIKSTAGCAGKNDNKSKLPMIQAFMKEKIDNGFHAGVVSGKLKATTAYLPCVDDIVDSYWAVKTMLKKEGFVK